MDVALEVGVEGSERGGGSRVAAALSSLDEEGHRVDDTGLMTTINDDKTCPPGHDIDSLLLPTCVCGFPRERDAAW